MEKNTVTRFGAVKNRGKISTGLSKRKSVTRFGRGNIRTRLRERKTQRRSV